MNGVEEEDRAELVRGGVGDALVRRGGDCTGGGGQRCVHVADEMLSAYGVPDTARSGVS